jgi:hypothetical protein
MNQKGFMQITPIFYIEIQSLYCILLYLVLYRVVKMKSKQNEKFFMKEKKQERKIMDLHNKVKLKGLTGYKKPTT